MIFAFSIPDIDAILNWIVSGISENWWAMAAFLLLLLIVWIPLLAQIWNEDEFTEPL